MRSTQPIYSPLGIGVTLLVFVGLGFSFWWQGGQMLSPGKLTSQSRQGVNLAGFGSHADFETQCALCHAPFQAIQADLCLRCHTTVLDQAVSQTGTHGRLPDVQQCRNCHPDHLGRDADITAPAFSQFDHDQTGFNLRWHQLDYHSMPMDCYACHNPDGIFQQEPQHCHNCHAEYDQVFMAAHLQDFGLDCMACHDGVDRMVDFDHATTRFPLEGKHAPLACVACHLEGNFQETPLACEDCHLEPEAHADLFSSDCAACHTPEDWSALVGLGGEWFDHFEHAGFSLERHSSDYTGAPILCSGCHSPIDGFKLGFEAQACIHCHTLEAPTFMADHQAQFGLDCLACHDGSGRMANFDHDRFFILDGQHAGLSCEACHLERIFTGTSSECNACHAEPEIHAGYFGLQCESCHSTDAWAPAKLVSHSFPLDHGEQGTVSCDMCHPVRYTEYTCYGCHEHQEGEMIEEHQEEGITGTRLKDCVACHPTGLQADEEDD